MIGQGTAAVAARAVAEIIGAELSGAGVEVVSRLASELSGFELRDDMSDHLVVAISQSGTTTDTNRTVDLVQARGAWVTGVVNRRESDLAARADGVLYTSDGRDVEMSVASTKAFYAQVAAGFLLACAIAEWFGAAVDPARRSELLGALERLPEAMAGVLAARPRIADIAQRLAPSRRHWATVGNGRNRLAAEEVRIKLSELCYRSVACDITEDKKHIDLSAEPLTLVCAAGLDRSTARDVAKEVAIYAAHRGAPVTFTDDAELARAVGEAVLLPAVHPDVAFVLATMAGHLFGYEAALAIDACAGPLRHTRGAIEAALDAEPDGAVVDAEAMLASLAPEITAGAEQFGRRLRDGGYDGHLPAATALRLDALFRYALGVLPLAAFELDFGEMGTPASVLERLLAALSEAIEELTRPIDAIRHQAKTVTVGISRSEEVLLRVPLTEAVLAAGAEAERLSYDTLSALAGLDRAVSRVTGQIRYAIDGERIEIADRSGLAARFESRVDRDPTLRGTKRQVSRERRLLLTRGLRDGRLILLVPEIKGGEVVGLVLLHVDLHARLEPSVSSRRPGALPRPSQPPAPRGHRDRGLLRRGAPRRGADRGPPGRRSCRRGSPLAGGKRRDRHRHRGRAAVSRPAGAPPAGRRATLHSRRAGLRRDPRRSHRAAGGALRRQGGRDEGARCGLRGRGVQGHGGSCALPAADPRWSCTAVPRTAPGAPVLRDGTSACPTRPPPRWRWRWPSAPAGSPRPTSRRAVRRRDPRRHPRRDGGCRCGRTRGHRRAGGARRRRRGRRGDRDAHRRR